MKRTILLLTVLLLGTQSYAGDISASYSDSNFEEIFHVDRVDSIEMWKQPKTKYTPKNLRTEQQMRFSGKEGTNSYNSYTLHLTDYDTYITESYFKDGKFYIKDNTGVEFQTGALQEFDTSALETSIQNNTNNINNNTNSINQLSNRVDNNTTAIQVNADNITTLQNSLNTTNTQVNKNTQDIRNLDSRITTNTNNIRVNATNIEKNTQAIQVMGNQVQTNTKNIATNTARITQNSQAIQTNANTIKQVSNVVKTNTDNIKALGNNMQKLDYKVDRVIDGLYQLDDKVNKGLATVTALTSLHPNPRHQGKTQIAVGTGMYNSNVAGAIGIFHYLNDKVMLSAGASYGGSNSWAGNVGISIGF